jgi:LysR family nitrogen assimilation transcriptional regulator
MDIRQLRNFIRVVELGSFSRAAIVLEVAQPSLSRQVRLLEVELRQTLLVRTGRGVEPTEAGAVLLELGRGIVHQMDRMVEELGRVQGQLAGRVAIGLPPTWAKLIALPLMKLLRSELPNATLAITEGLSLTLRDALLVGQLDMALLYDVAPTAELEVVPLREDELCVVGAASSDAAPDGMAMTLHHLATLPLVIPARPHAIRTRLESELDALGLRPRVAYEIDGVSTNLDLVRDGAGYAVLPAFTMHMAERPADFRCWPVVPRSLVKRLVLAVSARRAATQTQKATFRVLADLVRATQVGVPGPQRIAARAVAA